MSGRESKKAVVAGHICLDMTPVFAASEKYNASELFIPGKLINVNDMKMSMGGVVPNTGFVMAGLGIDTKLMGKIGDDYFGNIISGMLKSTGTEGNIAVAPNAGTSYTIVLNPPGIDRIFLHNPGANDIFYPEDIDYDEVKNAELFHFGYPPLMRSMYADGGDNLAAIFRRVKEYGATTSLDMAMPDRYSDSGKANWEKILEKVLPYVDIYMPSIEETLYMIAREHFEELNRNAGGSDVLENLDLNILPELGKKLASYGTKIVVIKCGSKGYYIRTQDCNSLTKMGRAIPGNMENWSSRELFEENFRVDRISSTTGAGDSSIAGFLAAFLNGASIEKAMEIACAVAAQKISANYAATGIKGFKETTGMINSGWEKNRIHIKGSYWRFDRDIDMWIGKTM